MPRRYLLFKFIIILAKFAFLISLQISPAAVLSEKLKDADEAIKKYKEDVRQLNLAVRKHFRHSVYAVFSSPLCVLYRLADVMLLYCHNYAVYLSPIVVLLCDGVATHGLQSS